MLPLNRVALGGWSLETSNKSHHTRRGWRQCRGNVFVYISLAVQYLGRWKGDRDGHMLPPSVCRRREAASRICWGSLGATYVLHLQVCSRDFWVLLDGDGRVAQMLSRLSRVQNLARRHRSKWVEGDALDTWADETRQLTIDPPSRTSGARESDPPTRNAHLHELKQPFFPRRARGWMPCWEWWSSTYCLRNPHPQVHLKR